MTKVLFICHGNICRSPMAEFVMKDLVAKAGLSDKFEIASAATSTEEIGNPVYPPARRKLAEHGISWCLSEIFFYFCSFRKLQVQVALLICYRKKHITKDVLYSCFASQSSTNCDKKFRKHFFLGGGIMGVHTHGSPRLSVCRPG